MGSFSIKKQTAYRIRIGLLGLAVGAGVFTLTGLAVASIAGYIVMQEITLKDADERD